MDRSVSDRDLIAAVVAGDPDGAALFVERFYRFIVAIAGRYSHPRPSLRENVPQNVIAKLWEDDFRRLRMWSGEGDFASYLAPIVKRTSADYARTPWNRRIVVAGLPGGDDYGLGPFGIPDDEQDAQSVLIAKERRIALAAAMERLGGRDRDILERKWFGEESVAEIAAALGINENAAHQALHRAARHLRARLLEDAPELFREPLATYDRDRQ